MNSSQSMMNELPGAAGGQVAKLGDGGGSHELSLLDLGGVLADNLRMLVGVPLAAGLLALGGSFLMTPMFTSTTTIMVPQQQQSAATALLGQLGGLASGLGAVAGLKNPADQWVGLLKSRTVADALVEQFNLKERYDVDYLFEAREALADRMVVVAGKDGLINVSVNDKDPVTAAKMATACIAELQKLSGAMALTEAAQRRLFFEHQLLNAKNNLTKAEQQLQRSGVSEGTLNIRPESALVLLSRLKAEIVALEVRIPVMRGYLAEGSVELKQAQSELASLRHQLAKAERGSADGGSRGADYVASYRDFKYHETLYELMARQYEIARVDEARDGAVIQVVDVAQVPEWKSKPKRALIAVAASVGAFFAAVLFALARNAIRNVERDVELAPKWTHIVSRLRALGRRA